MRASAFFCLCLLPACLPVCGAFGQTTDAALTFEVASVKPHVQTPRGETGSSVTGGPGTDDPGQITVSNRMLRTLIIEAYGIRGFQIEHPPWVEEARFDIVAKVPRGATKEQAKIMMRNLLAERFKLQIRRENRNLPVYDLAIAKGGVKMKPSAPAVASAMQPAAAGGSPNFNKLKTGSDGLPEAPPNSRGIFTIYVEGKRKATGQNQSLSKIVTMLAGLADRPVIDRTDLKGDYDFSLSWSDSSADNEGADLFAAVQQQLGLRMEPRKMPVEMLIVVSALKVPTEN